jgi:hypothetical protein
MSVVDFTVWWFDVILRVFLSGLSILVEYHTAHKVHISHKSQRQ